MGVNRKKRSGRCRSNHFLKYSPSLDKTGACEPVSSSKAEQLSAPEDKQLPFVFSSIATPTSPRHATKQIVTLVVVVITGFNGADLMESKRATKWWSRTRSHRGACAWNVALVGAPRRRAAESQPCCCGGGPQGLLLWRLLLRGGLWDTPSDWRARLQHR